MLMYPRPLRLAFLVLLMGCDSTAPKQSTYLLFDGTVMESSGAVIPGADVSVRDFSGSSALVGKELASTRTGTDGRYSISYYRCATDPAVVVYYVRNDSLAVNSVGVECKAERQALDISITFIR